MAIEELVQLMRLADPGVRLDVDAEFDDRFDLARDERTREAVLGDAEHHHAAEPLLGLVHRNRMTGKAQVARGGQSGRSAADNTDARKVRGGTSPCAACQTAFAAKLSTPNRSVTKRFSALIDTGASTEPAPARTLARCRAHTPADRREGIRRPRDEIRLARNRPSAIAVT